MGTDIVKDKDMDAVAERLLNIMDTGEYLKEQARRIRLARNAAEMSQADLSAECKYSRKIIRDLENAKREAKNTELARIAKATGQKLRYIQCETDEFIQKPQPGKLNFKRSRGGIDPDTEPVIDSYGWAGSSVVEHRTFNPGVEGSSPSRLTSFQLQNYFLFANHLTA